MLIKSLIYSYVFAATSLGAYFEISISGGTGISAEHLILGLLFMIIVLNPNKEYSQRYILAGVSFVTLALLSLVGTLSTFNSLHLLSFCLLIFQIHLFIAYKELISDKVVNIAFILLFIQVIFFRNGGENWGFWDLVWIPGFGIIQRLSILGFVSNSLAIMAIPFLIYFCMKYKEEKVFIFLLLLISVLVLEIFTVSRVGLLLSLIVLAFYFPIFILISIFILVGTFYLFFSSPEILSVIKAITIRQDFFNNPRFRVWVENFNKIEGFEHLYGKGIMSLVSDNSFLSIYLGGGLMLSAVFFTLLITYIDKVRIDKHLVLLWTCFAISILSYDVFSQRKILFAYAFIGGFFIARHNSVRG